MVQQKEVKLKMFQHLLTNRLTDFKSYFIGFIIGLVLLSYILYSFKQYQISKSQPQLELLSKKLDSLTIEIQVKESQRIDLEKQIRDKKIEIQEVTVTKYLRPKINSPDSSFIFLKEFIK